MDQTNKPARPLGSGTPEEAARDLLAWHDAWNAAWEALETNQDMESVSGREWLRLTAQAQAAGVPACQSAMRDWILYQRRLRIQQSVTEESLARRQARAKERGEYAD